MDNVIDAKNKGMKLTIKHVRAQPELAPDIDLFHRDEFFERSLTLIEDKLIDSGIVIPRERLKNITSVLPDIGKLYYAYVTLKLF